MEQEKAVASCANALTALRRHLNRPPSLFDRHEAIELLESLVRLARTQAHDKAEEYSAALDEVNLHFQNSVNALLPVRRMSLSPISASKRRRSMDQCILKTTSESEEDQTVDTKVSVPLDPSTLHITESRREDTRNSEVITVQKMRVKMIFPHPSAIQQNKCFQITRDRGQTRFAERVHMRSLLLSAR